MMVLGVLNTMVPHLWLYLRYWSNEVDFSSARITFDTEPRGWISCSNSHFSPLRPPVAAHGGEIGGPSGSYEPTPSSSRLLPENQIPPRSSKNLAEELEDDREFWMNVSSNKPVGKTLFSKSWFLSCLNKFGKRYTTLYWHWCWHWRWHPQLP